MTGDHAAIVLPSVGGATSRVGDPPMRYSAMLIVMCLMNV